MGTIGRSYSFLGDTGTLAPILPLPAGASKARIAKARVAISTALSGVTETFTLALDSTVIATALMADGTAVKDFTLSSTKADADTVIPSGPAIATGALTLNIPALAAAYYVVVDIEWDIDAVDLLPALS